MNYTLNDLSSLQEYEIQMLAKNIEGNSLHTERLQFKTKGNRYLFIYLKYFEIGEVIF
jgi:hypothetical protein